MTAADAILAALVACFCVAALAAVYALVADQRAFADTVTDMAPPPRNSDRRDAADEPEEA